MYVHHYIGIPLCTLQAYVHVPAHIPVDIRVYHTRKGPQLRLCFAVCTHESALVVAPIATVYYLQS